MLPLYFQRLKCMLGTSPGTHGGVPVACSPICPKHPVAARNKSLEMGTKCAHFKVDNVHMLYAVP